MYITNTRKFLVHLLLTERNNEQMFGKQVLVK